MQRSLGLGGDGDEVDAVECVERTFGVAFAVADCESFETVGDVWAALIGEMRLDEAAAAPLWPRFATAIASETGVDPARIGPGTRLLAEPLAEVLKRAALRLFRRR
ncbi:MAG TPA: hypothetical protein VEW26_03345 [Allosphingosinicella sp.]|nr:hypothetical protein [Allosphingosinicella sp.]